MLLSDGELKAKLSKINQFLVGEISKLLIALNVETPCRRIYRFILVVLVVVTKQLHDRGC